jgi:ribosome-associated translation inhibitor RaiA
MKKRIVFRNTEHSEAVEQYANKQLEKIVEFLANEPTPVYLNLVLEPSKVHAHNRVELIIKTPHFERVTEFEGPKFHDVLDKVIDTMYLELHEDDKRRKDRLEYLGRRDDIKKQH